MSQTAVEPRDFPVPMRWLHAGSDPSRPGQRGKRTVRSFPIGVAAAAVNGDDDLLTDRLVGRSRL